MELLDRHRLEQLSHDLSEVAGHVRMLAAGVRGTAGGLGWHSPAARAAAESLEVVLGSAHRLAGGLDEVGAAVGAHGRRAAELAHRAAAAGAGLAGRGVHFAERVARP